MKLKIISSTEENPVTITYHEGGKVVFNAFVSKKLDIKKGSYIQIGIDEDEKEPKHLYMKIVSAPSPTSLPLVVQGGYNFYVNCFQIFKLLWIMVTHRQKIAVSFITLDGETYIKSPFPVIEKI